MDTIDFIIERLILKTGNSINSKRNSDLEKSGLTSSQSETILYYSENSGSSIKELAEHLQITHQAARKLIDKLKSKGILASFISDEDRRCTKVYLTEKGKNLCDELKKNGSSTGEFILNGFSDTEKCDLLNYLKRIENNIKENGKK